MPLPAFRRLALALALVLPPALAPAVLAETTGQAAAPVTTADLSRILMIPEIIGVMRAEGLDYGLSLEDEMFPGRGGAGWAAAVALVYDEAAMRGRFEAALAAELGGDPATMAAMAGFFDTAAGQRILTLEIEARRALMDEGIEAAAQERAAGMTADEDPRMAMLVEFATVNDLVEANVQGALNANLAFYQGMAEGGAFGDGITEEQMLSDVWAQEPDIRAETEDWLFPFLALAYGPLSDDELQAYTGFSRTPAGQKMNAALFAAFDAVFVQISRDLGRAVAQRMIGDDI
jgi:hypothetical protein